MLDARTERGNAEPRWTALQVAGTLPIASLVIYWFLQPVGLPLKSLGLLFLIVSLVKPAAGLLAFAGLAPVSTVIATRCGATGMGGQFLELMALAAGLGAILPARPLKNRTRIGAPALFMAAVAMASAAAMIPAEAAPIVRSLGDGSLFHLMPLRQTAEASPVFAPVFTALVIAECGLLAWAVERSVRRTPELAMPLVALGLIGHAAAAAFSLHTVVIGALRTGEALQALPRLLMTVRLNAQMDVNAAASALVLAGVAGFALVKTRTLAGSLLLLLVAAGVWVTGSRIAFVMAAGAAMTAVGWTAVKSGRRRLLAVGGALLIFGVCAWLVTTSTSSRSTPLSRSVELRGAMAKAGLEMFKSSPVFGIGVGQFYDASTAYAGPYLQSVGWSPAENAHNNFIQVLAEQGLVGLAALLWMLAVTLSTGRANTLVNPAFRGGLLLAIVACIGTWLTGHPLLVPEFAFVFWFYCGVLGAGPAVAPRRHRWLPGLLVAAILVSVVPRAGAIRNAVDLEHRAIGLSLWQHDDSQRYREAGTSFTIFLQASGQPTRIPMRRAPGAPELLVIEVRLRGQLVDRLYLGGEMWQVITVAVPQGQERFAAVDFTVRAQSEAGNSSGALLRIGKAVSR